MIYHISYTDAEQPEDISCSGWSSRNGLVRFYTWTKDDGERTVKWVPLARIKQITPAKEA